jgi:hypothetical protein
MTYPGQGRASVRSHAVSTLAQTTVLVTARWRSNWTTYSSGTPRRTMVAAR